MRTSLRLTAVIGAFVIALLGSGTALAANYHFVGSKSCVESTSGTSTTVTCNFSVAGLGNASTATASIQSPFNCSKLAAGKNSTEPGGLASSGDQTFQVQNGRINVTDLVLSASCPDQFAPTFTGPVSVYVNGVLVGTIQIS